MKRKSSYFSKKTKLEKTRISVYISNDLFQKVSKKVPEVYDTLRGGLSFAVEEGLKHWLLEHSGTLIGTHQNPRQPVRELYNAVIGDISHNHDFLVPTFIKHGEQNGLLVSTMRALNVKERSATTWIQRFCAEGLIKPYRPPMIRLERSSDVRRVLIWELVAREA